MAVMVWPMVDARARGDLHGIPGGHVGGRKWRACTPQGLGTAVVGGGVIPESLAVSREEPLRLVAREPRDAGPILSDEEALRLTGIGLRLEALFGRPQDVEWAIDGSGGIFLLQSRAIAAGTPGDQPAAIDTTPPGGHDKKAANKTHLPPPLIANGRLVSSGAASGRAVHAQTVIDVAAVPRGAVLLTPTLSPALARLAGWVSAGVAAAGSRAGHFASVARESGLPVLVFGPEIFTAIADGQEVTVDADAGVVLPGTVEGLARRSGKSGSNPDTPVGRRLEKIVPWWPG